MHTDNFNENYESYKAVSLTVALDFSFFFWFDPYKAFIFFLIWLNISKSGSFT